MVERGRGVDHLGHPRRHRHVEAGPEDRGCGHQPPGIRRERTVLGSDGGRQVPGNRQLERIGAEHIVGELPEQGPYPEWVAVGLGPKLGSPAALQTAAERGGRGRHRRPPTPDLRRRAGAGRPDRALPGGQPVRRARRHRAAPMTLRAQTGPVTAEPSRPRTEARTRRLIPMPTSRRLEAGSAGRPFHRRHRRALSVARDPGRVAVARRRSAPGSSPPPARRSTSRRSSSSRAASPGPRRPPASTT